MKFRRIYWVTEQLGRQGHSHVAGVYTSVHDLIERGLVYMDGLDSGGGLRVSLVQLDSATRPLGTWVSPDFAGLEEDLREFVQSQELSAQECESLASSLRAFAH